MGKRNFSTWFPQLLYIGQTKRQFGTCLKGTQRQFYFAERKITPCRIMLAKLTIQFARDNSEIITTNSSFPGSLILTPQAFRWETLGTRLHQQSVTSTPLFQSLALQLHPHSLEPWLRRPLPDTYLHFIKRKGCYLGSVWKYPCNSTRSL